MILSELRSFKVMYELFIELANKDPSLCYELNVNLKNGFLGSIGVYTSADIWSFFESMYNDESIIEYILKSYKELFKDLDLSHFYTQAGDYRKDFLKLVCRDDYINFNQNCAPSGK